MISHMRDVDRILLAPKSIFAIRATYCSRSYSSRRIFRAYASNRYRGFLSSIV